MSRQEPTERLDAVIHRQVKKILRFPNLLNAFGKQFAGVHILANFDCSDDYNALGKCLLKTYLGETFSVEEALKPFIQLASPPQDISEQATAVSQPPFVLVGDFKKSLSSQLGIEISDDVLNLLRKQMQQCVISSTRSEGIIQVGISEASGALEINMFENSEATTVESIIAQIQEALKSYQLPDDYEVGVTQGGLPQAFRKMVALFAHVIDSASSPYLIALWQTVQDEYAAKGLGSVLEAIGTISEEMDCKINMESLSADIGTSSLWQRPTRRSSIGAARPASTEGDREEAVSASPNATS